LAVLAAALVPLLLIAPAPAADAGGDFKYLPADTNLLFVIRMDQLLASDVFKKMRKEIPMFDKEFEGVFLREFGFEIGNIERMTMGGNVKGERPIGIFHLKDAVKAETILKARSAPRFPGDKGTTFKEEKVGANTMYVPNQEFREAFCVLNDKTMVFGTTKALKATLEQDKKPDLPAGLQAALKEADAAATVTLAMDLKAVLAAERPPMIPGVDFDKVRDNVTGASLTVKLGNDIVIRGVAVCKDEKAAEEVKTQAEAFRTAMIEQLKKAPPGVPKELMDLPGKVKLSTNGNLGVATATVKDDVVIAFVKVTMGVGATRPPAKPIDKKP
jgi:hypothetical protein